MIRIALSIAGSDSGGGAGIQADLKTFAAFGVFGTTVLTALTAQNTLGVRAVAEVAPPFVRAQLDAIREDFAVASAKTGMLARRPIIETVATHLRDRPLRSLVVDPVMVAASGDLLLAPDAVAAMRELMLPLATVITPNVREAEILSGVEIGDLPTMHRAALTIVEMGAKAALVKGGRLNGSDSVDVLCRGSAMREFKAPRIAVVRAHGTGCTLSAAIAASMALGADLEAAVETAKNYVTRALATAERVGHGATPLNHLVQANTAQIAGNSQTRRMPS
jgi:hydroxymethylpyrimidine/phosphomethylpyrimidine kinase